MSVTATVSCLLTGAVSNTTGTAHGFVLFAAILHPPSHGTFMTKATYGVLGLMQTLLR